MAKILGSMMSASITDNRYVSGTHTLDAGVDRGIIAIITSRESGVIGGYTVLYDQGSSNIALTHIQTAEAVSGGWEYQVGIQWLPESSLPVNGDYTVRADAGETVNSLNLHVFTLRDIIQAVQDSGQNSATPSTNLSIVLDPTSKGSILISACFWESGASVLTPGSDQSPIYDTNGRGISTEIATGITDTQSYTSNISGECAMVSAAFENSLLILQPPTLI